MGWFRRLTSIRLPAAALAALLFLSACGDDVGDNPSTGSPSSGTAFELMESSEAEPLWYTVTVDVPEDWYEVDTKEGFHYQYLWEDNDWDDILAQDFDTHEYTFTGEFFAGLLEESIGGKSIITVRDENAELGSYPAIIIDVVYESDSFTSLTYVNVEGRLWEFTVNSQTPEGLRRGEEINATAEFHLD